MWRLFIILVSWLVCMSGQAQELQEKEQRIQEQKERLRKNIRAFFVFSHPSSQKMLLMFKVPEYKRLSVLVQSIALDAQENLWDLQQALAEEKDFLKEIKRKN